MKRIPIWTCFILLMLLLTAPVQAGRVPDTGQTTSYTDTFGEDSDYLINEPSYTKLSASGDALPYTAAEWAMVQDNVTKLTWEVKTDDLSIHDKDTVYNWADAQNIFISFLNASAFGGHSDWRLSSIRELTSIVARNVIAAFVPAINTAFFGDDAPGCVSCTRPYYYWTSTTRAGDHDDAWSVQFSSGVFGYQPKTVYSYYVRAVRGVWEGQALVDNGDGTVTDMAAGLMWQQQTPETPGLMRWEDALIHCETLDLAGHSDWRLPNINELQSLVDYSRDNPTLTAPIGLPPGSSPEWRYWSSTTRVKTENSAWLVDFQHGYSRSEDKIGSEQSPSTFSVRAVRGGQNKQVGHLFILTPNQASRWVIGRPVPITWETPQEITGNVKILVSHDGGKTFDTTIAESTENDGSYEWQATGPDSVNCVLKIDPLDEPFQDKGTTQGLFTVWTNEAPSQPTSSTPADQASEQSLDVDLSWAPSTDPDEGDTVTYTVYFGTAAIPQSQPPVAEGHTTTTFDPGMLSCNGIYFWQIVAVDNHAAQNPGPVWRFSTTSVPGDVSGDCAVDLTDAILTFQVLSGLTPAQPVFAGGAVNGDGNNGPELGAYILQEIGGLR